MSDKLKGPWDREDDTMGGLAGAGGAAGWRPEPDPKEVVDAVFTYLYNRSHLAVVLDVFRAEQRTVEDLVPAYVRENLSRLESSVARFYGHLDDKNQRRFVELALAHSRGKEPATSAAKVAEYVAPVFDKER